jgi:hypothetical protein
MIKLVVLLHILAGKYKRCNYEKYVRLFRVHWPRTRRERPSTGPLEEPLAGLAEGPVGEQAEGLVSEQAERL